MIILLSLIIIFILIAYLFAIYTSHNTISIMNYLQENDPEYDPIHQSIVCILEYGLGNRMKCLSSAIVLSRYLNRPLYVVWTDIDVGSTKITDIWQPPYPFKLLDKIPPGLRTFNPGLPWYYQQYRPDQTIQLLCPTNPFKVQSVTDLIQVDDPIIITRTYWAYKHKDQNLSEFNLERRKVLTHDLIPVDAIKERI